jgi:hypothetical protein
MLSDTVPVVLFTDLDDSLFQSRRKCRGDGLEPAALNGSGEPHCFTTPKQRALFELLSSQARVVAVTARSSAVFGRCLLPIPEAICSFGGVILDRDGAADPEWSDRVAAQAEPCRSALQEMLRAVQAHLERSAIHAHARTISDLHLDLYLSIKHLRKDAAELAEILEWLRGSMPDGWRLHRNDSTLAVLPPYLGKEKAVEWFIENRAEPGTLTLGMGDSLTDAPFLALCDYTMMPSRSQLGRIVHSIPAYGAEHA